MAVTAAISGGIGLGTAIYGAIKSGKANKEAKRNLANRPVYESQPIDNSEVNIAESQAGQGMSDAANQAYMNNANSGLATSISAIAKNGGDANAIGNAYGGYERGINSMAIYNDQARQNHLSTLVSAYAKRNAMRQGNADKEFQFNRYAPWADKQQLLTQQKEAGQKIMMDGIGTFTKALTAGAPSMAGMFGGGGGGGHTAENIDQLPLAQGSIPVAPTSPFVPSSSPFMPQEVAVPEYTPKPFYSF